MKINWSSLTKEQKQIVVLIGIGSLIVLFVLYQFVLQPIQESIAQRKRDIASLHENNAKASKALEKEGRLQADVVALKGQLTTMTQNHVPSFGNTLAWVTEQIYQSAKDANVEIEGLTGGGQTWGAAAESGGRSCVSFAAQVNLQCSYLDLLHLLRAMESRNPLIMVTSVSIDGREQTGRHQISLSLEWPSWVQAPAPSAAPGMPSDVKTKKP